MNEHRIEAVSKLLMISELSIWSLIRQGKIKSTCPYNRDIYVCADEIKLYFKDKQVTYNKLKDNFLNADSNNNDIQ